MNDQDLYATGIDLWNEWLTMWNERPELARVLAADGFVLHVTTPSAVVQETVDGPLAVERWVIAHRAKFQRLAFRTTCGPFVDVRAGVVAGPWVADAAVDGAPLPVCGMDAIAFRDGKVTEYWTLSRPVDAFGRWGIASNVAPR